MTQNAWDTPTLHSAGDGKVLIGQTGPRPLVANITGCAIDVTNGTNSISLDTVSTGDDYVKISSSTASASTSIDFTGLSDTYHMYIVEISDMQPGTDGSIMWLRTSTDNGVSFDSGISDYTWNNIGCDNDGSLKDGADSADSQIEILGRTNDPLGAATNETHSQTVWIFDPSNASSYTRAIGIGEFVRDNGNAWLMVSGGQREENAAVDAIRFIMDSGTIASGVFTLYGAKA